MPNYVKKQTILYPFINILVTWLHKKHNTPHQPHSILQTALKFEQKYASSMSHYNRKWWQNDTSQLNVRHSVSFLVCISFMNELFQANLRTCRHVFRPPINSLVWSYLTIQTVCRHAISQASCRRLPAFQMITGLPALMAILPAIT